ncbi:putative NAD(P) dependent steroid dehydrogenase-like protein [Desarmillaria tabescens]|uniref:NAD(P) dependent steroid dehydrogenase-like protein n=1 Tax=Armillaria tabescens TaxID=1929756 RepID=A0AA39KCJ8_ARMTA|nr:putative NAD(P) dependent steroid dehydrogenase-like protein [Desarmillaria tabescens]KAK0458635.1 putative NAD(P) dependent steroid dehydrogenase-like protein [Desarmillaria tabescens]
MVIGGSGFLGSHIVGMLKAHGDVTVGVLDLVQPSASESVKGVEYFIGDITDETHLTEVLKQVCPAVVYHTASPIHGLSPDVYFRVNEEGTHVVVSSCRAAGIKRIMYTSSTGVVWMGADFARVKEDDVPVPSKGYDAYHHTKALGEKIILNMNDIDGMKVVVLRPCGMTGERDKQLMWRVAKLYEDGQQNVQIGDNTNLVDYLYTGNAVQVHILAADCLLEKPDTVAGQIFFIINGQPMPLWTFN